MRFLYLPLLALAVFAPKPSLAAAHIYGGMCQSQGSWLQTALSQNKVILDALTALKDDPACKVLTDALTQIPKISLGAHPAAQPNQVDLASSFRELSDLNEFVSPEKFKNLSAAMAAHGQDANKFQDAVFNVVFNESYEKIKDLGTHVDSSQDTDATRASQSIIGSQRLQNYLDDSEQIANAAMATSQTIMKAIPQSTTCFQNHIGVGPVLLGALAQTSAALISGGKVTGIGEFTASVLNFSRDMKFYKSISSLEYEQFKNSVSCLVETTSESYCATQDAENSLEMLRFNGQEAPKNLAQMLSVSASDPVASPVAGLVIYMRDIPVVQDWLQRVLYGISPRQIWQGNGKNDNWSAYLGFVTSANYLEANFSDKEQLYLQDAKNMDQATKMGRVREIFNDTVNVIRNGAPAGNGPVNFYLRAMQTEMIPFFLLGVQMPADFNTRINDMDTMWLKWTQSGVNGFDNPDHLLQTVKENLKKLTDRAREQANQLFTQRMVIDPLNLVTVAMRGPGVSAYQAFVDQRTYYNNLITKLQTSVVAMSSDNSQATRRTLLAAHIPLLKDSVRRLDLLINALQSLSNVDASADAAEQSDKIMDVIYNAANMLVSWDNFFGLRMQTALQADLSDTLWRRSSLTEAQRQYFLAVGPDLVSKLAGFYSTDPVSQRADLSAAKVAQAANLKAVEQQFAKVLFNEILDIDCKTEGGYACDARKLNPSYDPAGNMLERANIKGLNNGLAQYREGHNLLGGVLKWMYPVSEDSKAMQQVKAKYCVQALAFESRELFQEICKGATMASDLTDGEDSLGLNVSFDDQLTAVKATLTASSSDGRLDKARTAGVCALRSYLRKNHVYYMYRDYNMGNE